MEFHPPGSLCKSLIITVMGAGNRCVLLMESPESQNQMNAYYLKENKNILKSPTSRDTVEIVGVETSSVSACGTLKDSRPRPLGGKSPPSEAQIYAWIIKKEDLACPKTHSSTK